ncbi:MAG: GGDEF domain-containing protein [Dokdonella sp.]
MVRTETDLFEAEEAALAAAVRIHTAPAADAEAFRRALGDLIQRYERMMRESRRMIRHGDRQERELNALNIKLRDLAEQLDYKARHDALTGEFNRGAIIELATQILARSPLSLVVLDIDLFKRINDEYGHPVGDEVIIELVRRIRTVLPTEAQIGRVGGEEFTVLLARYDIDSAMRLAHAMRRAIADQPFSFAGGIHVTASFGVSASVMGSDFVQAYARADAALYEAKRAGRNAVQEAKP